MSKNTEIASHARDIVNTMNQRIEDATRVVVYETLAAMKAQGIVVQTIERNMTRMAYGVEYFLGEHLDGEYIGRKCVVEAVDTWRKRPHPFESASHGDTVTWKVPGTRDQMAGPYLYHGRFEYLGAFRESDGSKTTLLARI